ncbi:hypothetical protein P154DRAFT_516484 [Amniculicola lignicola CBS 123094]|uniref:F-box domain-containing protein n=1 Tax=Amniculicola lignicola CBS 123094 TaxID=1392246 RepID=A0A6A5X412_9PLEO|nr:hypothetical protein P154DRAFT_516484 [Amniculicola lignicola CBS 123094]
MARLDSLPNELLTEIFRHVRTTDPASLKLFLVCRSTHRSAKVALYEHVSLLWKLNSQCSVLRFLQLSSANVRLVRSLRLEMHSTVLTCFMNGMKVAHKHVNDICGLIASLSTLHTFSVNMGGKGDPSSLLPASIIVRLLEALLQSVVNLELDTETLDARLEGYWNSRRQDPGPSGISKDANLCSAISLLIPRLHTLRLRITCICPEIFSSLFQDPNNADQEKPTSQLRQASIKLALPLERRTGRTTICDCRAATTPISSPSQVYQAPIHLNDIFAPLLRFQMNHAFPLLQSFLIFAGSGHVVTVSDVVNKATTVYPFTTTHHNGLTSRKPLPGYSYMIWDHEGLPWFGEVEDVWSAIEEGLDLGWREEAGVRLAPTTSVPRGRMHRLNCKGLRSIQKAHAVNGNTIQGLGEDAQVKVSYVDEGGKS